MTAQRLLRLYPRAWRHRYGDEFLAVVGPGRITLQQAIDIASGAVDAWLSTDVNTATRVAAAEGGSMLRTMICRKSEVRYTTRDAVIGAIVMIVGSIVFVLLGTALKQLGLDAIGEAILSMGFMAAFMLSLPFWLMKGQPWKATALLIGTTVFLLAIGFLSNL